MKFTQSGLVAHGGRCHHKIFVAYPQCALRARSHRQQVAAVVVHRGPRWNKKNANRLLRHYITSQGLLGKYVFKTSQSGSVQVSRAKSINANVAHQRYESFRENCTNEPERRQIQCMPSRLASVMRSFCFVHVRVQSMRSRFGTLIYWPARPWLCTDLARMNCGNKTPKLSALKPRSHVLCVMHYVKGRLRFTHLYHKSQNAQFINFLDGDP